MYYLGSTMTKRAGNTEKVSISLRSTDAASLRKRAKRLYDGNLSAVIAELAADAALLEGMHDLVDRLGGPILTDETRQALDREWTPAASPTRSAGKRKVSPR